MSKTIITNNKFKSMFGEHFINYGVLDDHNGELFATPYGKANTFYGKKHTKESREQMKRNHADISGKNHPMWGKKHSEETRRKISESQPPKDGKNNPMYGKNHTEETKAKMRAHIFTEEHKRKISLAAIERYKDKTNTPMYGRKHTEESKRKNSLWQIRNWKIKKQANG
tara:strand:- start:112 stop:618 length:507 start_codon:yes stop_codon:yes gene_type:complete